MSLNRNEHLLLTPAQMNAADRAAIDAGASGIDLMQAAGAAIAQAVSARWSRRRVVVLCGPGNNGGDGFVVARLLTEAGWPVRVGLAGSVAQLAGDAAHHAGRCPCPIEACGAGMLQDAELVIDALFGAGLSRDIEGEARQVLEAVRHIGLPVCAVDVPSGVDGESGEVRGLAVPADLTVTFFRKKPGHVLLPGRSLCGEVLVADIGIPVSVLSALAADTWENTPSLWLPAFPWPQAAGHKYARGHVLVAGGEVMTGAARLAARAAQRIGAGLVSIAVPASSQALYAAAPASIMLPPVRTEADFAMLLEDKRRNSLLIGPGAGPDAATAQRTLAMLSTARPTVLDADALTVFAKEPGRLFRAIAGPCVMTPHEGEFARLFGDDGGKLARARKAASDSGAVILLKGSDTVIAAPDGRATINTNAPATLATGGSGDVLAGMIAGLMAQGMDAFRAACAAAWLHGQAAHRFGPGLVADDLPEALPGALGELMALAGVR